MDTLLTTLSNAFTAFFAFKAYVILPVIMLLLAFIARMRFKKALLAAIHVGAGFAGVFIVFSFFVAQISPAIESMIRLRSLAYPVIDIGWPPLAAITWSSALTPLFLVAIMLLNVLMLVTGVTRNLYLDLWNYWHFAFLGVMVQSLTGSVLCAILATLAIAVFTIKTTEWSAPYVKREMGLDGIAVSPLSVSTFLPYSVALDRLFDHIPGLKKLNWNPSVNRQKDSMVSLLSEPMIIGILVGVFLSFLAGYSLKQTLETAVNFAAVMFLLPQCGGLIGSGMGEISHAFKVLVEKRFPHMENLSIAMDTGFLLTNPSVIATGLILMPLSILLAFILPGNRVIPLGDLPNLISVISLTVLIMRGNVIRSVLAGIPIVATFMIFASRLAPVFTAEAARSRVDMGTGSSEITAFTDGGNQLRFWVYNLFDGNWIAIAAIPVVLALMIHAWRRSRAL
ncbi:MAG: PTS galactitol transporter subunit IIC [Spirochaetales bacterium]|nr:PTS galactitol transporter subunit IIC [Spirochaetales bacterium]